jgi:hypothetical protein
MSPSKPLGTLIVPAGLPGVEVSVFDGKLRKLLPDESADDLRWSVPRGLYKVRYQAGSAIGEQIVSVDRLAPPVQVVPPHLEFTSSAPLTQTASTHEYHTQPAVDASRRAPRTIGSGASLFAMIRSRSGAFGRSSPADGLTLVRDGRTLVDFSKAERDPANTCAALHVELDPGAYTLQYDSAAATMRQTVFLPGGWQTQLFVSETTAEATAGLDIPGLAVLLARPGMGFEPGGIAFQASELARKALRRGQPSLTPEQTRFLLDEKFENPMLGVLAAHLLILRPRRNNDLIKTVLQHLERMTPDHPDLACLQLAIEPRSARKVMAPPMLARSWDLLVEASSAGPTALDVPAVEEVAGSLWDSGGAWLTWGHSKGAGTGIARERSDDRWSLLAFDATAYFARREKFRVRDIVAAILETVADGWSPDLIVTLEGARAELRKMSDPPGSRIAGQFDLTESETAFINAAVLEYARNGADGLKAEALAGRLRMPAPLVRTTASRLVRMVHRPRTPENSTPPTETNGGSTFGASS